MSSENKSDHFFSHLMLHDFLHSERRIVPQPGGINAAEQGAKQGQDSFLQSSVFCVKFLEGQKYIWRGSGKTSNPPWPVENEPGDKQMQFHTALQNNTEDARPSVFNSTPVEHGAKEDAESPAEDGKAKPGNTPGMCVHWPRNSVITTIAVIVARHSKFAAIEVDGKAFCIQDAAHPWPGVVSITVRAAEGRRVLLPVRGAQHPTAVVLKHEFIPCLCDHIVTVIGWL